MKAAGDRAHQLVVSQFNSIIIMKIPFLFICAYFILGIDCSRPLRRRTENRRSLQYVGQENLQSLSRSLSSLSHYPGIQQSMTDHATLSHQQHLELVARSQQDKISKLAFAAAPGASAAATLTSASAVSSPSAISVTQAIPAGSHYQAPLAQAPQVVYGAGGAAHAPTYAALRSGLVPSYAGISNGVATVGARYAVPQGPAVYAAQAQPQYVLTSGAHGSQSAQAQPQYVLTSNGPAQAQPQYVVSSSGPAQVSQSAQVQPQYAVASNGPAQVSQSAHAQQQYVVASDAQAPVSQSAQFFVTNHHHGHHVVKTPPSLIRQVKYAPVLAQPAQSSAQYVVSPQILPGGHYASSNTVRLIAQNQPSSYQIGAYATEGGAGNGGQIESITRTISPIIEKGGESEASYPPSINQKLQALSLSSGKPAYAAPAARSVHSGAELAALTYAQSTGSQELFAYVQNNAALAQGPQSGLALQRLQGHSVSIEHQPAEVQRYQPAPPPQHTHVVAPGPVYQLPQNSYRVPGLIPQQKSTLPAGLTRIYQQSQGLYKPQESSPEAIQSLHHHHQHHHGSVMQDIQVQANGITRSQQEQINALSQLESALGGRDSLGNALTELTADAQSGYAGLHI